jgi:hypothetical protein
MTNPLMWPVAVSDIPDEPPAGHGRPLRHHRGLYWVAVLAALAALATGALITASAYVSESEPETAAVAYFHALGRGDAAGALGLGNLPPGPRTYLTREVLHAALSVARISDVRVLSVTRHGRTAKVTLEYHLGSAQVSDAVPLVRHGRGWRLTRTAVPVHLQVIKGADRMTIAGARVPNTTVLLFPGALPVTFDTPNLDLGKLQVVHLDGAAVPQKIQPVVSPAGKQRVDAAARAAVQACVSGKTSHGCPRPARQGVVPGSVRGRVVGNVDLQIAAAPGARGLLKITGPVKVEGSYQQLDFNNQPVRRTGSITLMVSAQCYATSPAKIAWAGT